VACAAPAAASTQARLARSFQSADRANWAPRIGSLPGRRGLADAGAGASFTGISCSSSDDCAGVGYDDAGALIERWSGGYWQAAKVPIGGRLEGVSCASPSACVAVGYDNNLPRFAVWNGQSSVAGTAAIPKGATSASLSAVACPAARECLAVGEWTADHGVTIAALAEQWNGTAWSLASLASPVGQATFAALDSISCPSATSCLAVGNYHDRNDRLKALAVAWNGTTWRLLSAPDPTRSGDAVLAGGSCSTPTSCVAVGNYALRHDVWHVLVERWNGSSWSIEAGADPALALFDQLNSVSCDSAGNCTAVGFTENEGLVTSPLIERSFGGGPWTITGAPPAWSGGTLLTVSCRPGGWCIVGGGGTNLLVSGVSPAAGRDFTAALTSPIVGVAATPDGRGYYLASADGTVRAFGDAVFHGGLVGQHLAAPIVAVAVDPATGGYWLLGGDGGVFAFDAPFFGSTARSHIRTQVVGIEPTRAGNGYRLVSADGGVFAFGGASYCGSMGGRHLNRQIVGIADDARTGGYWLVAADGGVFAFRAPFYGSGGSWRLRQPIIEVSATARGDGYRFVAEDGGVFGFGGAVYAGSLGGRHITSPVAGMAAQPSGPGYWLAQQDGAVTPFGGVPSYGSA
jgi:hypothetical protein